MNRCRPIRSGGKRRWKNAPRGALTATCALGSFTFRRSVRGSRRCGRTNRTESAGIEPAPSVLHAPQQTDLLHQLSKPTLPNRLTTILRPVQAVPLEHPAHARCGDLYALVVERRGDLLRPQVRHAAGRLDHCDLDLRLHAVREVRREAVPLARLRLHLLQWVLYVVPIVCERDLDVRTPRELHVAEVDVSVDRLNHGRPGVAEFLRDAEQRNRG